MDLKTPYKYIILVAIAAIGIFIEFRFLGSVGSSIVDIMLFLGFLYLVFSVWKDNQGATHTGHSAGIPTAPKARANPIFDIQPASFIESIKADLTLKQFVEDQFFIIWNFLLPHNGYVFHKTTGGDTSLLYKQLRADITWDDDYTIPAVLQLVESRAGDILIENNLEPGSNLIPYYAENDFKLQSVLGFRIVFMNAESLFFVFDADEADFFNSEELAVLKKVMKTVSLVVNAFLSDKGIQTKYISSDRKLTLSMRLNRVNTMDTALDTFTDFIAEEFEASKLTIALRCQSDSAAEQAEIRKSVGIEDVYKKGYRFTLDDGLNGWVIQKNKPYIIDNIDKGEYFIPRFSKEEKTNYGIKSFLSVPLRNQDEAIGMVTLEHSEPNQFNDGHKEVLTEFVRVFSSTISRLHTEK